jgi:hypothetical protein
MTRQQCNLQGGARGPHHTTPHQTKPNRRQSHLCGMPIPSRTVNMPHTDS